MSEQAGTKHPIQTFFFSSVFFHLWYWANLFSKLSSDVYAQFGVNTLSEVEDNWQAAHTTAATRLNKGRVFKVCCSGSNQPDD